MDFAVYAKLAYENDDNNKEKIKRFSDKYSKLYYNGNDFILAIRGTDVKDKYDLSTDVGVILGTLSFTDRYKMIRRKIINIKKDYGNPDLILCGHSLGGSLSIKLGLEFNLRAYAFNPGFTQYDIFESWFVKKNRIKIFIQQGDFISNLALFSRYDVKFYDAHSIDNFIKKMDFKELVEE